MEGEGQGNSELTRPDQIGLIVTIDLLHSPMRPTPMRQARPEALQTISDNELRLRQIDSDIERLNKQLAYLHRVRVQYAALVEAK